ncbi:hypothetical protein V6Z11_A01G000100 [Gossypium hirsutum]
MRGKKLKSDREREPIKKWEEIWIEEIYLRICYENRINEEEKENKRGRPRDRERKKRIINVHGLKRYLINFNGHLVFYFDSPFKILKHLSLLFDIRENAG